MAAGASAPDCPLCRRILLDENILVSYLLTRKTSGAALPQLAEDLLARVRSGFLSRVELARFCLDATSHILLAPDLEPGGQLAECDNLSETLIEWPDFAKLPQILRHCKAIKEWNAHLKANHWCPMCMQLVVRRVARYKSQFARMKRPADYFCFTCKFQRARLQIHKTKLEIQTESLKVSKITPTLGLLASL